jgi:hypothetical protein
VAFLTDALRRPCRLRYWIEAETGKDASPALKQEIEQIVGSIRFAG